MQAAKPLSLVLVASVLSACGSAPVPPPDEPVPAAVPVEEAAPPEGSGPPAAGTPIGNCPEATEELSVADGERHVDDEPIRMVAYLIGHAEPCPPCPADAQCEACAPPFELYGDAPPGGTGTGGSAWVTLAWFTQTPLNEALDSIPVGSRILLCGAWAPVSEPGASRVFRVTGLELREMPAAP